MIALLTLALALQEDWTPPPVSELRFAEVYACAVLGRSARDVEFPGGATTLQTPVQQQLWDDLTKLEMDAIAAADAAAEREGLANRPAEETLVREQIVVSGNDTAMQVLFRCMMVFGVE